MTRKVKYSIAYKLQCIKEALEKHRSSCTVSHHEDISESSLRKWITDYLNQGVLGIT